MTRGESQLVKYKDAGLYLQLYILIDYETKAQQTYVKNETRHEETTKKQHLLYEALTETSYSTADYYIIKNKLSIL